MASSASDPPQAAAPEPAPPERAAKKSSVWDSDVWLVLRDTYGTFDRRTLGFTRLMLGFYLLMDLFRRTGTWFDMFSDKGVLPTNVNLWRPQASSAWTLLNGFSTAPELVVLWIVIFITFVCLFVGYKTKVAQILAVVFVTSMNGRVLLIENGGYVVQNLLVMWTAFLPLGHRFSIDAMQRSMRRVGEVSEDDLNDRELLEDDERPTRYHTLLGFVLLIQLAAIYYFNVIHKTGPAWKNGTAVHYVLYVDRMVTPGIAQLRDYVPNWAILFMTKATLTFEATVPVALLSPLGLRWSRRIAIFMINALHIAFGTTFVLGPFAWAACVFSTLLFSTDDWELATRTMRREKRARVLAYDARSAPAVWLCRVIKRVDNFELITFRAENGVRGGLRIERPDGSSAIGAAAMFDIVSAIPAGPVFAWMLRLPLIRHGVDAAMRSLDGRRAERFFGVALPEGELFIAPEASPLRRAGRLSRSVLREVMILAMFAGAVNQAAVELWVINRRIRVSQPEPLRSFAHKLRFLQGWFMFSPNPVMDDGIIVADAITVDGRHVDPFTGEEPMFDLLHAKSLGYNQIWSDYFNRMHLSQNNAYRDAMKEYMLRLPERTGRLEDTIVSGEVYWVQDWNPKWNTVESYDEQRKKLFSFENKGVPKRADGPSQAAAEPPSAKTRRLAPTPAVEATAKPGAVEEPHPNDAPEPVVDPPKEPAAPEESGD